MKVTLYLERSGVIIKQEECDYAIRHRIADAWYRLYTGKKVTVFYKLESSLNYEQVQAEPEGPDAGYSEDPVYRGEEDGPGDRPQMAGIKPGTTSGTRQAI